MHTVIQSVLQLLVIDVNTKQLNSLFTCVNTWNTSNQI